MKTARLDAMEQYILQNEQVTIVRSSSGTLRFRSTPSGVIWTIGGPGHVSKVYGGAAARTSASLISMPRAFR
jgi:hypothetical protein